MAKAFAVPRTRQTGRVRDWVVSDADVDLTERQSRIVDLGQGLANFARRCPNGRLHASAMQFVEEQAAFHLGFGRGMSLNEMLRVVDPQSWAQVTSTVAEGISYGLVLTADKTGPLPASPSNSSSASGKIPGYDLRFVVHSGCPGLEIKSRWQPGMQFTSKVQESQVRPPRSNGPSLFLVMQRASAWLEPLDMRLALLDASDVRRDLSQRGSLQLSFTWGNAAFVKRFRVRHGDFTVDRVVSDLRSVN